MLFEQHNTLRFITTINISKCKISFSMVITIIIIIIIYHDNDDDYIIIIDIHEFQYCRSAVENLCLCNAGVFYDLALM